MVPALGRIKFNASGTPKNARGSALVFADRPLAGMIGSALSDLGALQANEARLLESFIVPVSRSKANGTDTGVAVFGSAVASNVKLTLRRPSGEECEQPTMARRRLRCRQMVTASRLSASCSDFRAMSSKAR